MRVNVYAEEMTDRVEIVEKEGFTGVRFYLELPVTRNVRIHPVGHTGIIHEVEQVRGPFMHGPSDDDSAAVTFWGKHQLRESLQLALRLLDEHRGDPADGSESDS